MRNILFCFSFLVVLLGCVGPTTERPTLDQDSIDKETRLQRIAYVKSFYDDQVRLNRLSFRVAAGAGNLCRDRVVSRLGAYFSDWDQRTAEWMDIARGAIGINLHEEGVEVVDVVADSPADRAGLQVGDHIYSVEGKRLPLGSGALREFEKRLRTIHSKKPGAVTLGIRREASYFPVTVETQTACDFPAILTKEQFINAYTDGTYIWVTRGMMRFVETDDELATILAHEMAHITMGHVEAKKANATAGAAVGMIFDILAAAYGIDTQGAFRKLGAAAGAHMYSQEFEAEADYVGMYFLAKAGFPVAESPAFWRRMGTLEHDAMVGKALASHPSTAERFIALDKTADEIQEKIRLGMPLEPKFKVSSTDTTQAE